MVQDTVVQIAYFSSFLILCYSNFEKFTSRLSLTRFACRVPLSFRLFEENITNRIIEGRWEEKTSGAAAIFKTYIHRFMYSVLIIIIIECSVWVRKRPKIFCTNLLRNSIGPSFQLDYCVYDLLKKYELFIWRNDIDVLILFCRYMSFIGGLQSIYWSLKSPWLCRMMHKI